MTSKKKQIVFSLASEIRANVESFYAGRLAGAAFTERQREAWNAAERHGIADLLRNRLIELDNEAKAAKASSKSDT